MLLPTPVEQHRQHLRYTGDVKIQGGATKSSKDTTTGIQAACTAVEVSRFLKEQLQIDEIQ